VIGEVRERGFLIQPHVIFYGRKSPGHVNWNSNDTIYLAFVEKELKCQQDVTDNIMECSAYAIKMRNVYNPCTKRVLCHESHSLAA
jgi:hypothetical protein